MAVGTARADRVAAPRFGLRFDRGRAQLVLGEPLDAGPLRLESLVAELSVGKGRISLREGWRAFRHRRTTLVEARISIALADLARLISEALGGSARAEVALIGGSASVSLAMRAQAQSVVMDLAWGWDDADLLLALTNARALPRGPRGPIASAHDLLASLSAELDDVRGAARLVDPLERALLEVLLPAGVRVPSTRGIPRSAQVVGGRLVLSAGEGSEGPETARDHLEAGRSLARATAALVQGDLPRARELASALTPASSPLVRARAVAIVAEASDARTATESETLPRLSTDLACALEERPIRAPELKAAALAYTRSEPHGGVAADALVLAASALAGTGAHRAAARALGRAAIERLPLDRSLGAIDLDVLARAIELATADTASLDVAGGDETAWEPIVRALAERVATQRGDVAITRAHALALEHAGRPADALTAFRAVLRRGDDEPSATGLARVLGQLERWDEALSAWDRVASLRAAMGHDTRAREARLHAARAAEQGGRLEAAIARLEGALEDAPPDLPALEATSALAARLSAMGRASEAAVLDRRLPGIVDALGAAFAIEGHAALVTGARRAIGRGDDVAAQACLDALGRLVPESAEVASLAREIAVAAGHRLVAGDPSTLRKRAEALRAEGRTGDAARVLVELFAASGDAAVLRAAVELAERSGDAEARASVLDRALAILPPGAARDAIALRRGDR